MTRIRIEGLLAAFPKLVGSGKQHTYVETENVRYVYQPLEGLFLLLVTNKQSNILEDLETLRLLSKLVPDYCQVGTYDASHDVLSATHLREALNPHRRPADWSGSDRSQYKASSSPRDVQGTDAVCNPLS